MKNNTIRISLIFVFTLALGLILPFSPFYVRTLCIIPLIFISSTLLLTLFIKSNCREYIKNTVLLVYSIVFLFYLLEMIFMFVPQSHGVGKSRAGVLWTEKYWKPLNSLGYRDIEVSEHQLANKKNVLVVGGSFTGGGGIKNYMDRYSNVLEGMLGKEKYNVFNLGLNSNTTDEFERIMKFPVKPDVIILQYFVSDITSAAEANGIKNPSVDPYDGINLIPFSMSANHFLKKVISGYYLLDFIYWQYPHAVKNNVDILSVSYNTPKILDYHKKELYKFIEYSRNNSCKLIFLGFPSLLYPKQQETYLSKIINYFKENNVPTINAGSLVENIPITDRIVNKNDPHPNEAIHKLVATKLNEIIIGNK